MDLKQNGQDFHIYNNPAVYEGVLKNGNRVKFVDIHTKTDIYFFIDYCPSNQYNSFKPLNFSVRADRATQSLLDLYSLIKDYVANTPKKDQTNEEKVKQKKPSNTFTKRFVKIVKPKEIEKRVEAVGV